MNELLQRWTKASRELGFELLAPYSVKLKPGVTVTALFLVKNFGGVPGTLVFTETQSFWRYEKELVALGYGYSVLDEPSQGDSYSYSTEGIAEVLSDWGWTGDPALKPAWVREPEPDEAEDDDS